MATAPTAAFLARAEQVGGAGPVMLFHLTATAPAAATWYCATRDLDADALYTASPAYRALIRSYGPIPAASALGGLGGGGGSLTLELEDALDASGKRFFDAFATNVPGYAEPYDLLTLGLSVYVAFAGLTSTDVLQVGGRWVLGPDGFTRGEGQTWSLTFVEDETRWKLLPRRTFTRADYPHLPTGTEGRAIPVIYNQTRIVGTLADPAVLVVPAIPLDEDGSLYGICEITSDGDWTLNNPPQLYAVRQDPESQVEALEPIARTAGVAAAITLTGNGTARGLDVVAQRLVLSGEAFYARSIALSMRMKTATAGAGNITVSIMTDKDGLPSDELVSPGATGQMDSALITNQDPTWATFEIPFLDNNVARAAYIPTGPVWVIVKYAQTGGNLSIEEDSTGAYADGYTATGSGVEWNIIGKQKRRGPVKLNFTGLGYLRKALTGGVVTARGPAKRAREKGLYVGLVNDAGVPGMARLFMRFKISDWPGAVISARLLLHVVTIAGASDNVSLMEVTDFGTLTAAHWDLPEIGTISTAALTPSSPENAVSSIDVTTAYNAAKVAGRTHFALKGQYALETQAIGSGQWYLIGARGKIAPRLVINITTGTDLELALYPTRVEVLLAADAHNVSTIECGDGDTMPPLGPDVRLAVTIAGVPQPFVAGSIVDGPSIIEHLAESAYPDGLDLDAADVDGTAFDTARTRLAGRFPLAVYLGEQQDPRAIFAEIAKGCRSVIYTDQEGKLSIWTESPTHSGGTPVRTVRPWEHGPLTLRPLTGDGGAVFPVTHVSVYYGRDWVGLQRGGETPGTGYDGFAILSKDQTDPPDTARQTQITAADARYGLRALAAAPSGPSSGPSPESSYPYVPVETASTGPTGALIRDELWDTVQARPAVAQVVEVDLPWFALGWRLMDEFNLESWAFPSGFARVLPTTAFASDETTAGPDLYQARSARCQVRALGLTADPGAACPVRVTALIRAWNTG